MSEQRTSPEAAPVPGSEEEAPTLRRPPTEPPLEPGTAPTWVSTSGHQRGEPPSLAPGQTLAGRYTVLDRLGQGGMGLVLAAYDSRLDRRVALKLLHQRGGDSTTSQGEDSRMVREAQAMARLNHPNVVAVYDAGTLEDGSVFLAMEYVQGQTLRQWQRQRPRSWRQILAAWLAAGRGLAAAHAAGLIHRDIKPDNVLMGEDGRVRVTDFGLARARSAPDSLSSRSTPVEPLPGSLSSGSWGSALTLPGSFLGTPGYMAPELLRGHPADVRSDVFAFCAALYESLYGMLPFRGTTPAELLRDQLEGKVAAPPESTEVPPWLSRTVMRGLSIEPHQRPGSIEELLLALEDDPEVKRRAWLRGVALASVVVVLAGLAAWGWARQGEQVPACGPMEPHLAGIWDAPVKAKVEAALVGSGVPYASDTFSRVSAVLEGYTGAWVKQRLEVCESARGQPAGNQGLGVLRESCLERRRSQLQALTAVLSGSPDPALVSRAVQAAQALPPLEYCADARALTAAVPPPEDPRVRAQVDALQPRVDGLEALFEAGKYKDGLALGQELLAQVEPVGHAPLKARVLWLMARLQEATGDFTGSEATARGVLLEAARGKDLVLMSRSLSLLPLLMGYRQSRPQEALLLVPVVEAAAEASGDDLSRALAENNLATVAMVLGKYAEAFERFERALALRQKVLGPEHIEVANALNNVGSLLQMMQRSEEASVALGQSLKLREKLLGPGHPLVAGSLNNLGLILQDRGRYEEARQMLERALALRRELLGPEHADTLSTLSLLGQALMSLEKYEEAREVLERALVLRQKVLGPGHQRVAGSLDNMGYVHTHLGHYTEAKRYFERALAVREKTLGPRHPDVATTLLGLAELELARGRPAAAIALLEKGLTFAPERDHPWLRFPLAQALWTLGRERARAVELATQALEQWRKLGNQPKSTEVSEWLAAHSPR